MKKEAYEEYGENLKKIRAFDNIVRRINEGMVNLNIVPFDRNVPGDFRINLEAFGFWDIIEYKKEFENDPELIAATNKLIETLIEKFNDKNQLLIDRNSSL